VRKHGAQNPAYRLTSHFISFVSTPLEYLETRGRAGHPACFGLFFSFSTSGFAIFVRQPWHGAEMALSGLILIIPAMPGS